MASDAGALKIPGLVSETTVDDLTRIVRPEPIQRMRSGLEFKIVTVDAVVIQVRYEQDGDLHLLLADVRTPKSTIIAEVPDPKCADESHFRTQIYEARKAADDLGHRLRGSRIRVRGILFWDKLHGQLGSKNGLEIHPVLGFGRLN